MCGPYLDIDSNRQTVQKIMIIVEQLNIWTITGIWRYQKIIVFKRDNGIMVHL